MYSKGERFPVIMSTCAVIPGITFNDLFFTARKS